MANYIRSDDLCHCLKHNLEQPPDSRFPFNTYVFRIVHLSCDPIRDQVGSPPAHRQQSFGFSVPLWL
jgi:hypothetical protein